MNHVSHIFSFSLISHCFFTMTVMMPWPAAFVELPWPWCDSHLGRQTTDGKAGPPDQLWTVQSGRAHISTNVTPFASWYQDHIASGYEMKLYQIYITATFEMFCTRLHSAPACWTFSACSRDRRNSSPEARSSASSVQVSEVVAAFAALGRFLQWIRIHQNHQKTLKNWKKQNNPTIQEPAQQPKTQPREPPHLWNLHAGTIPEPRTHKPHRINYLCIWAETPNLIPC